MKHNVNIGCVYIPELELLELSDSGYYFKRPSLSSLPKPLAL